MSGFTLLLVFGAVLGHARACPFDHATTQTLGEETAAADVVVLAKRHFAAGSLAENRPTAGGQRQAAETSSSVELTGAQPTDAPADGEPAVKAETSSGEPAGGPTAADAPVGAPPSGSTADLDRPAGTPTTESSEEATPPGAMLIVGSSLVAVLVLLALLWVILRGAGGQKPVRN